MQSRGSLGTAGGLQPLSGRLSVTGAHGARAPRPFLFISRRRRLGSDVRGGGGQGQWARYGLQLLTMRDPGRHRRVRDHRSWCG